MLLVLLFEYFKAGGLEKKESERIWYLFMDCVYNMEEYSHEKLVEHVIEKWALPLMKTKGNS